MNFAVIGSGGREHAICFRLNRSKKIKKLICIPGNAGTKKVAENINADISDFENVYRIIIENKIDFVVIGPEQPLVDGIVDYLSRKKIRVFGPNKFASQLEGSKAFVKKLCQNYNIPTANFGIFDNFLSASNFIKKNKLPIVIKADGLASGKGVYICKSVEEAENKTKEILGGKFKTSKKVVIEEFLEGEEMSYFVICDGKDYKFFQTAQDHKRVGEGDTGPNTGGMGAYSPSRLNNDSLQDKINKKIIKPTMAGLKEINTNYIGFLYVGLMICENEPYLIEFNVRMGDPECQTILPLLKSDLAKIILSCCKQELGMENIEWLEKKSLCIVLCSNGYPGDYKKKVIINNVKNLRVKEGQFIIHAGTKFIKKDLYSYGGRVLNIVVTSNSFETSKKDALKILERINWKYGFYRKDIGYKVT